jgi:hypothetical protein
VEWCQQKMKRNLRRKETLLGKILSDGTRQNLRFVDTRKPKAQPACRLGFWVTALLDSYFFTSYSASITSSPPSFFSGLAEGVGPAPGVPSPALE